MQDMTAGTKQSHVPGFSIANGLEAVSIQYRVPAENQGIDTGSACTLWLAIHLQHAALLCLSALMEAEMA